jgi:prophage tail gpP-like protein
VGKFGINDIPVSVPGLQAVGTAPSPKKEDASLSVNGKKFEGWESISIKRSIKAISGSFELSVTDKWAQDQTAWFITPGNECVLSIGKEKLITGFIDGVAPSFTKESRTISISGRDKTGDLVDCSAVHKPGNWSDISLLRLANIVGAPFGITATSTVTGLGNFINFNIQNGESAFEALDRAAKLRGVLLTNDGTGNILITRTGSGRSTTNLQQGVNILSAQAEFQAKERHSKYIVKGQGAGNTEVGEVDLSPAGIATDLAITRYRPLIVMAEGAATPEICNKRAQWEATVRAAKSSTIHVIVQGWRQADGKLWELNKLVKLKSAWLGVNQDFLITSVDFKKGNGGTLTTLELERPDAYTPDPTLSTKKEPWTQLVLKESVRR